MKVSDEQTARWKKDAVIAYNTKAFQQSFEVYWHITGVLRVGMSADEEATMKAIKKAVWDKQE